MKKIIITIDNEGTIEVQAQGIKGKGCEKVLEPLIKQLNVVSVKKTPEWTQEVQHNQSIG
jgi:hypothetical protein